MPITKKRLEPSAGLGINTVVDKKFKTNMINIRLLTEYDINKAAAYAIIPKLLISTNEEYPDRAMLIRRFNALYGTTVVSTSRRLGGIYELSVDMSFLCDRYALDGECISDEAAKLLLDCVLRPALEGGGFLKSEFNTQKINLLNQIDSEINDKLDYAMHEAFGIAYRGESSADRYFGTRERVEALSAEQAYSIYQDLLKTARIEISFCGAGPFDSLESLFTEAFKREGTAFDSPKYYAPSPCKATPEYGETALDVQQANLILIFKTNGADHCAMTVLSSLYGETPQSKLFKNVREKLSLCYFCSSAYIEPNGVLYVVSGVAPENIEPAKNEIISQLNAIKAGDFTDEDIADTKRSLATAYRFVGDSLRGLDNWYFNQTVKQSTDEPEDKLEKLNAVTRGELIAAAEKIQLDTVFVLKPKETE